MTDSIEDDWYEAERLHRAADHGDLAEIVRLVSSGHDINKFDDISHAPLHYAAMSGQAGAATLLISLGANIDANDYDEIGETALALAVRENHLDLVRLLLQAGADPDINGWMGLTARIRACSRNDAVGTAMCALFADYPPKFD
jgi:ankyrin repeat protein